MQKKQRKTPQTWIMYKMGRNFLGDIIWQDTSLCKQFIDLQLVKSFQSKIDLYETTVNAVLVN
jgi:hypothetical protein